VILGLSEEVVLVNNPHIAVSNLKSSWLKNRLNFHIETPIFLLNTGVYDTIQVFDDSTWNRLNLECEAKRTVERAGFAA